MCGRARVEEVTVVVQGRRRGELAVAGTLGACNPTHAEAQATVACGMAGGGKLGACWVRVPERPDEGWRVATFAMTPSEPSRPPSSSSLPSLPLFFRVLNLHSPSFPPPSSQHAVAVQGGGAVAVLHRVGGGLHGLPRLHPSQLRAGARWAAGVGARWGGCRR